MVRSCEREGWSGNKLDLVWTSLWCIDDSAWFLKACMCCSRLFFLVIFGALSWWFSWSDFGTFLLGIWRVKGLYFGVFDVLGLEEFLAGFLRFLLIWRVLVDSNLAMDSPWGVPTIPKVLRKSVERFRRSGFGFGGVDPRVLFIPRSPGHTGLTSADPVGFFSGERLREFSVVPCCCCAEFGSVWSSVGLFGVLGISGWDKSGRCVAPARPV
jgi:hypothetical protein